MNKNPKRIAVVGCKHTTRDLILGLARHGFLIDHCVTIPPEKGHDQKVAGYMDLRSFLVGRGISYTVTERYDLRSDHDRESLLALNLDLLLIVGWQRLIPDWWLESLSVGAFGMHGSSKPLPHGRGRSPLNWSLIQGKEIFYTHLFQYLPGVDDGPIVGVQMFDITPFDTCHTLHFKNQIAMVRLCAKKLPFLLDGSAELTLQSKEGASYYPKRSAEDGLIYWEDTTEEIYNLIRAVTHPFPGAYSFLGDHSDQKMFIWRAIPFDSQITWPDALSGEVVEVFYDGSFIVKTGDGSLLVLESEGFTVMEDHIGCLLGTCGISRKEWEDLPE